MKKSTKKKRYIVRDRMLNDIWTRLLVKANVDVFGTDENRSVFPTFWGARRCWDQDWSNRDNILFLNPPVHHYWDVVYKMRKKRAKGIVILPDWCNEQWYHMVWPMTVKYFYYGPDRKMYEGEKPEWGSWAIYIDGSTTMAGGGNLDGRDANDKQMMVASAVQLKRTQGSRRRYHKRTLQKYLGEEQPDEEQ